MYATAMVLDAPRRMNRRQFPVPAVGDDDAILRLEACGLCGTDHEQYTGALAPGFAFVPGHESIGVIEEIGPVAAARWNVDRGDRVAVEVFQSCRTCDECERGEYRRCRAHGIGDMYGFISAEKSPALWGGYATHQYLAPDSMVLSVPPALDPVVATLFNPLGAGIRWGVTVPGTKPGDNVAVLGPGIRGLSVVAAVKEAGAGFVMVAGSGPNDAPRLDMAKTFGADLVVDVAVAEPAAEMRRVGIRGVDIVVDVTANAPAAFTQATALARPGGTVVVAGTRGPVEAPGFQPDTLVYKELRVLGALGVDAVAYRAALEMLAAGRYPFADVPRRVTNFDGIEDLLLTMAGAGDGVPPIHGVLVP